MRTRNDGRRNSRPFPIRADSPTHDEARYRALMLGLGIRMPSSEPAERRRPHRGQLPDVDLSRAVVVSRPSALARLFARLRRLVRAFIRSECEEAAMRVALSDAAPLYRDAPEAREARAEADRLFDDFMRDLLPGLAQAERELAGDLIAETMTTVGKRFSETPRGDAEIDAYADAMADMFAAYAGALARGTAGVGL